VWDTVGRLCRIGMKTVMAYMAQEFFHGLFWAFFVQVSLFEWMWGVSVYYCYYTTFIIVRIWGRGGYKETCVSRLSLIIEK